MTEREKMEQGLLYDANYDEELLEVGAQCKDLCFSYNQLKPSLVSEQEKIIRQLFGKTGKQFYITAPFWCDYGCNIEIGENFYTNHNCIILDGAKVVLVTMFLLRLIVHFLRRATHWIPNSGIRAWSMPIPLR